MHVVIRNFIISRGIYYIIDRTGVETRRNDVKRSSAIDTDELNPPRREMHVLRRVGVLYRKILDAC